MRGHGLTQTIACVDGVFKDKPRGLVMDSSGRTSFERAWHICRTNSNPFRHRYNVLPTIQIPVLIAGEDGDLELAEVC